MPDELVPARIERPPQEVIENAIAPCGRSDWNMSDAKRTDFLRMLIEGMTVKAACVELRIPNTTPYNCRKHFPQFEEDWADARAVIRDMRVERADEEMFRLGVEGYDEPLTDKGKVVTWVKKQSRPALKDFLTAHHEAYKEGSRGVQLNVQMNVDMSGGRRGE